MEEETLEGIIKVAKERLSLEEDYKPNIVDDYEGHQEIIFTQNKGLHLVMNIGSDILKYLSEKENFEFLNQNYENGKYILNFRENEKEMDLEFYKDEFKGDHKYIIKMPK